MEGICQICKMSIKQSPSEEYKVVLPFRTPKFLGQEEGKPNILDECNGTGKYLWKKIGLVFHPVTTISKHNFHLQCLLLDFYKGFAENGFRDEYKYKCPECDFTCRTFADLSKSRKKSRVVFEWYGLVSLPGCVNPCLWSDECGPRLVLVNDRGNAVSRFLHGPGFAILAPYGNVFPEPTSSSSAVTTSSRSRGSADSSSVELLDSAVPDHGLYNSLLSASSDPNFNNVHNDAFEIFEEMLSSGLAEAPSASAGDPNESPTQGLEIPEDLMFDELALPASPVENYEDLERSLLVKSNQFLEVASSPAVLSTEFESISSDSENEEDNLLRMDFEWTSLSTLPDEENPLIQGNFNKYD